MAERDIVGGIFGLTPEMYQRGLAARDTATNIAAAQLAPGQLAGYYAMEAGTGLGRAVPGLLGVEDPELAKIRDVQSMRGQFDISTSQGLRDFASALSAKGYADLASQAAAEADRRALTQAQTVRALREPGVNAFEKLLSSGKYTPASIAKYQQSQNPADLVLVKGAAGEGVGTGVAGPVGKSGAWRDADGIVYSAAEMAKQRAGFQGAEKLLDNLNAITPTDVKNAESWIDWTQGEQRKQIGGKVATKTVSAQAKINAAQLLKQIESLPPGSASNADMVAAKSSFPGYGDAGALQRWIDDTKTTLQNSLSRQAEQYGFKQRVPSTVTPTPASGKPGSSRENPIKL
jgi:hypothetical protein